MIQYQLLQCTSNCKKNEILVFSDGLEFSDSMKELAESKIINKIRVTNEIIAQDVSSTIMTP
jgi:hypothetical protein